MGFDIFTLIWQAGLLVQLVLVSLVLASAFSWGIIGYKWRELAGAAEDSEAFVEIYHEKHSDVVYDLARDLDRSPIAVIFLATCAEMKPNEPAGGLASSPDQAELRRISKHLSWTAAAESQRLERGMAFLATTGSSAPFVGLFGTVIGIIQAFQGIAESGSASLAVVAPGIAEALIATAMGLLAAIPATIFYNIFVARIDNVRADIDLFCEELTEDLATLQTGIAPRGVL